MKRTKKINCWICLQSVRLTYGIWLDLRFVHPFCSSRLRIFLRSWNHLFHIQMSDMCSTDHRLTYRLCSPSISPHLNFFLRYFKIWGTWVDWQLCRSVHGSTYVLSHASVVQHFVRYPWFHSNPTTECN